MTIKFRYKNYKGEERERTVDVHSVEYRATPGFGYGPGWFISGRDHEKNGYRSFALSNIIVPYAEMTAPIYTLLSNLDTLEKGYTVVNPADSAGGLHGVLKK